MLFRVFTRRTLSPSRRDGRLAALAALRITSFVTARGVPGRLLRDHRLEHVDVSLLRAERRDSKLLEILIRRTENLLQPLLACLLYTSPSPRD